MMRFYFRLRFINLKCFIIGLFIVFEAHRIFTPKAS